MTNVKKACAWVIPGVIVFLLDRLFKYLFVRADIVVIPGIVALRGARNTGMALGLFQGNAIGILIVSCILIIGCVFCLRKFRISGLGIVSISMILGGAVGNAIDRAMYGYVIDMIELLFVDFYIFNIADVGVVCGAILCGISLLFRPQDWSNK